jgi:hypothetical protein
LIGGSPQFGGGDAVCRAQEDGVVAVDTTTTVTVACDIP